MVKRLILGATAALIAYAPAQADSSIAANSTLSGVVVAGKASVYEVFGHPGNPGGDYGVDSPAVLTTFSAAGGNVFTFSASGSVSCCSDSPNIPADGGGSAMSVGGANGLSGLSGNHNIPLVGVFTTETDPFGGAAPAALSFDGDTVTGALPPLLDQVFYIGDGLSGYLNASGTPLAFLAPTSATRLYLGAIDAFSFNGTTGYYNDNQGSFTVDITLTNENRTQGGVPEPSSWALLLLGFGSLGAVMRRRPRLQANFA